MEQGLHKPNRPEDEAVYKQEKTDDYIKLKINQPKSYNTDIYTVVVQAGTANAMYNISVFVHDKPTVAMDNIKAALGDVVTFQCLAEAYPLPTVRYMFQPCNEAPWGNCSNETSTDAEWHAGKNDVGCLFWIGTQYKIYAREPGILYCNANNSEGSAMGQAFLLIENVSDFMMLKIFEPKGLITVGDNVTFVCSVMIFADTATVTFESNGKELQGTVVQKDSKMHIMQLTLFNVGLNHTGDIFCNVTYDNYMRPKEATFVHMEVLDAIAPYLRSDDINQTLIVDVLTPITFKCDIGGTPEPTITWFKDAQPFEYNMSSPGNTSSITIENANPMHSGLYECIAKNKKGNITLIRNVIVRIPDSKWNQPIVYIMMSLLLLIAIPIGLIAYFTYKKKKQLSSLPRLEDGIFAYYNPVIPRNEEAKLPFSYKSQYEFPLERLKLLTQLGTGAFGVVMKAIATNIKLNEETTIVAVKIVKDKHDDDSMRALLSELKILTHLGRHLNVVNLLGAVTQNISNHELMLIVEYCAFGNLQDYLQKHRRRFMDQISHQSDEILQTNRTDRVYQYNIVANKQLAAKVIDIPLKAMIRTPMVEKTTIHHLTKIQLRIIYG
ncbi:vascular endothelial growth factor receptor 1-like [Anopheles albimanus]|uniref:vascular endothelial growth factor receptor 1-like n=1 Tax=Anopheles albimanus TaxID=7167 RepID=UPI00163F40E7|nr:vascular endothelial growth factor receptor 1-like [Anopheles albimanus]